MSETECTMELEAEGTKYTVDITEIDPYAHNGVGEFDFKISRMRGAAPSNPLAILTALKQDIRVVLRRANKLF